VLLVATGVTTPEALSTKRPYIFIGAFIIGMFLTPPDVISQTLLAVPMYLLFEVGIYFSRHFTQRQKEFGEARERMIDEEYADSQQSTATKTPSGTYRNSLTDARDDSTDEGP